MYYHLSEYKNWWISGAQEVVIPKRKQEKAFKPAADDTPMVPINFYELNII